MISRGEFKNVLMIGAAGGLAQITLKLLKREYPELDIVAVDARKVDHLEKIEGVEYREIKYTRGAFENIFRNKNYDVVLHLGRLTHATSNPHSVLAERLDLSVMGTDRILNLSLKFNVKKVILLSTFHVYGANKDNPVFIKEDAPLRASIRYNELMDVVDMDRVATNWMWKYRDQLSMVILRPCNIIGSQINNAISNYLVWKYAPYPVDYDPMFQFIHEFDMASVIAHSVEHVPAGVYNVAPDEFISLKNALKLVGTRGVPVPMFLVGQMAHIVKKFGSPVPDYLFDYLTYSTLIDNSQLKKHLGDDFYRFSPSDALNLIKLV